MPLNSCHVFSLRVSALFPSRRSCCGLYLLLSRSRVSSKRLRGRSLSSVPGKSPINLLLGGDKAFARLFPARLCLGLGAARMRKPRCRQLQPFAPCLRTSRVLLRGDEPKGSESAQICWGSGFVPAQAAGDGGHTLSITPTSPCIKIHRQAVLAPLILVVVPCRGTTRCSVHLFSDNLRRSPRLPSPGFNCCLLISIQIKWGSWLLRAQAQLLTG